MANQFTAAHKAALHIVQTAWLDKLEFIRQHGDKPYCSAEMKEKMIEEASQLEMSARLLGYRNEFD